MNFMLLNFIILILQQRGSTNPEPRFQVKDFQGLIRVYLRYFLRNMIILILSNRLIFFQTFRKVNFCFNFKTGMLWTLFYPGSVRCFKMAKPNLPRIQVGILKIALQTVNPQLLRGKETSQQCTGLPSKDETVKTTLKEVSAKNERGYRLNAIKKRF